MTFRRPHRSPDRINPWSFLRDLPRVWPYLRPYWPLAVASVALMTLAAATTLIAPWPLALLVDSVLGTKPVTGILSPLHSIGRDTLLIAVVIGGLLVVALQHGLAVAKEYVDTKLNELMSLDFKTDLYAHVQKLSFAYHDQKSSGMMMFQVVAESKTVGLITVSIPPLVESLATLAGMFVIAYLLDPTLALVSLVVIPPVYYSTGYYLRRLQPQIYAVRGLEGQTQRLIVEGLSMVRTIVSFGREQHETDRVRAQGMDAVDARVQLTLRQTVFSLAVDMVTAGGTAAVIYVGAHHVLEHRLTIGELLVLLGYIAAMYQPLHAISGSLSELQQGFAAFRFALDLLDEEPDITDAPDAVELNRATGAVSFENVSFAHHGRERTLSDIWIDAAPGSTVGIVGQTGAGKTTLMNLLPRFYDVAGGRILLDGTDIRRITIRSLRAQISLVMQDPLLFATSIAENIYYGDPSAPYQEIETAARAARAHEFIMRLPEGYGTVVGERGARLSGGERQRIAIARAFLKNAPILVLDEPTSAIDAETESEILAALDDLMRDRTTFIIAHRLSTLRNVDHIVVLRDGRVVEQGPPAWLRAEGGFFAQLHELHTQGYDDLDAVAAAPGLVETPS